jgi:hypothetical protein
LAACKYGVQQDRQYRLRELEGQRSARFDRNADDDPRVVIL